jgi:PAS domain S-box-containing protein
MSTKKIVCLIGHTESTCNYIAHQLLGFLSEYIEVMTWCVQRSQNPPANYWLADIYIISNKTVYEAIGRHLPPEKVVLISDRIINTEHLDKLLEIEQGSRAFVVGTTAETVNNTISILHSLGIRYLEFIPYYPGVISELSSEVDIAITTGLAHLAPRHVKTIVDLGGKGIDLSTFAELFRHLNVPMTVLNDISHFYLEAILKQNLHSRHTAKLHETVKQKLEVILETVDEAIVAVADNNKVVLFNPAAEKLLQVESQQVIGKTLKNVIRSLDFSAYLHSGEGIRHKIQNINDHYYILNVNPIIDQAGVKNGVVVTFHPVQEVQEIETKVRRELKKKGNIAKYSFRDIRGISPEITNAISLAKRFAQTEQTILLEGESGTGKELFAQSIHNNSARRKGPFVAINFAAIPDSLVESELFGYEDGAFTGAKKGGRPGLFEEAHMGTIFLDEIGSASLDVQKRLLRVLEEREVRRLGSGMVTPIDVRVIAATNMELEDLASQGLFRNDLFYRLCALPIIIPPLRQRKNDILALARDFAESSCGRSLEFKRELANFLLQYDWPGNIRELQNVVRYLCNIVAHNQAASLEDIPQYLVRKKIKKFTCTGSPFTTQGEDFCIPDELRNPETLQFADMMLTEIKKFSLSQRGVGWKTLLQRLDEQAKVSEHLVKRWLRILGKIGYIEVGVTRQGTRITPKGQEFLEHVQSTQARK